MLHLTKQLSKLTGTMLLLALLAGCEKNDVSTTLFTGKVVDIDNGKTFPDTEVYVLLNSGLIPQYTLTQQDTLSAKTNNEGKYTVMHEPEEWQIFYHSVAEVPGYIQVNDIIGTAVKRNDKNKCDISLARASYLKLSIHRTPATSPDKTLNVFVTYPYIGSPAQGQGNDYKRDSIEFDMTKAYTNVVRGFYHKRTPSVRVDWSVSEDGAVKQNSQTIPLIEHDTARFEINY